MLKFEYRAFILGLAAIAMTGCAARPYDVDAAPTSAQRESLALDRCNAAVRSQAINDARGVIGCELAAERQMMVEIKLQDMSIFDTYAERSRLIGASVDSGQMSMDEGVTQYRAAREQFVKTLTDTYQANERDREHVREVIHKIGAGLAGTSGNGRTVVYQPGQTNCQSVVQGNNVSTMCF